MSDEETKCRVSYRDGKEIVREARKPYERATMWAFAIVVVMILASLAAITIDAFVEPSMSMHLQHLVDTGQIAEEVARYLDEGDRVAAKAMICMSALISFVSIMFAMMTLGEEAGKKALKKANDEKGSE